MANENKLILEKLDEIKLELDYIKERIADTDMVLTEDDVQSLKEAEKDLVNRKTKRL
ncbi:MAG TPA: hypothetical protein VJB94_02870 [Candidatus Nanoarchaeia archaeon]|nr:hypothetical protein [Candidatus Nanoarchaeia archaeon]